ncbi:MAG: hypothetical protein ABIK75_07080 [candidate division WOR-3 bacterium]
MAKIDLWTGKIIEEEVKPELKTEVKEEVTRITPEDIKLMIEKGKEAWKKMVETLEAWKREAEKRKVEEAFKRAGIEILPKEKKGIFEEMGIEKM